VTIVQKISAVDRNIELGGSSRNSAGTLISVTEFSFRGGSCARFLLGRHFAGWKLCSLLEMTNLKECDFVLFICSESVGNAWNEAGRNQLPSYLGVIPSAQTFPQVSVKTASTRQKWFFLVLCPDGVHQQL
jgi:hypothetical protein